VLLPPNLFSRKTTSPSSIRQLTAAFPGIPDTMRIDGKPSFLVCTGVSKHSLTSSPLARALATGMPMPLGTLGRDSSLP